jgi:hypothetical protein
MLNSTQKILQNTEPMGKWGFDFFEDTGRGVSPLTGPDTHLTGRNKTGTEQKQNRSKSETAVHEHPTKRRQFLDVLILFDPAYSQRTVAVK